MENIALLVIGIMLIVIGAVNCSGNISTVHAYNRRKVREADVPHYGRAVGTGTLIIGVALIADFALMLLSLPVIAATVAVAAIVVGLAFILYAQFKYNGGIF